MKRYNRDFLQNWIFNKQQVFLPLKLWSSVNYYVKTPLALKYLFHRKIFSKSEFAFVWMKSMEKFTEIDCVFVIEWES